MPTPFLCYDYGTNQLQRRIMADAHDVRKGVEIVFADNVKRTIYPLTIKALRKFVKIVDKMRDLDDMTSVTDEDINTMVEAAGIILEKVDPQLAENPEALEDVIDLSSFGKMMSVAMGASAPEE
jgi:hypothetical protein